MPTPNDLPQKLRDYASLMESGNDYDPDADLVRQAADEIERLQSIPPRGREAVELARGWREQRRRRE